MMTISKAGINFLIEMEGNIPYAYYCQAEVKTIGIGMVIDYLSPKQKARLKKVDFKEIKQIGKTLPALEDDNTVYTISDEACKTTLKEKLKSFETEILEAVKIKLEQHELDALVSFAFNIGIERFRKSTVLKRINAKASYSNISDWYKEVEKWLVVWNKIGEKESSALKNRRKREAKIFIKGQYERV